MVDYDYYDSSLDDFGGGYDDFGGGYNYSDDESIEFNNYNIDYSFGISVDDSDDDFDDEENSPVGRGGKCRYGENCLYRMKCHFQHTEKEKLQFTQNKMYF
jgi:hypothetical protein